METFLGVAGVVGFVAAVDSIINLCDRVEDLLGDSEFEDEKCRVNAIKISCSKLESVRPLTEVEKSHFLLSASVVKKKLEKVDRRIRSKIRFLLRENINKHLDKIDKLLTSLSFVAQPATPADESLLAKVREEKKLLSLLLDPKNKKVLRKPELKKEGVYTDEAICTSEDARFIEWKGRSFIVERVSLGTPRETEKRLSRLGRLILNMREWENPCVAKMVIITEDKESFCILSEVENTYRPLEDRISGVVQKRRVLISIASALQSLHDMMILHQGVGSHNVLVNSETQEVKLAGFLSSRMVHESSDRAATSVNDSREMFERRQQIYQSPERLVGSRYSFECDVYSLGIVMAEVHVGRSFVLDRSISGRQDVLTIFGAATDAMAMLIRECLSEVASKRPWTEEIVERLERME